jgi:hypothetical protein
MLDQEDKVYNCPDYMAPDYLVTEDSTGKQVKFVEECARLVTDLGLDETPSPQRISRPIYSRSSSYYRHSPSSVVTNDFVSSACPRSVAPDMVDHSHLCPWRRQMCDWAYTAMDTFELDREIVAVAFDMLDRFLAKEIKSELKFTREDFQLYVMVCLYTAVKVLEPSRKLSVEALTDMSRGYYSAEDVKITELEILRSLRWRINPPTAIAFVRSFLELVPDSLHLLDACKQFTELAVADSFFVPYKASSIATAAITLAAHQKKCDIKELQELVDLHSEEVRAIHRHIASL